MEQEERLLYLPKYLFSYSFSVRFASSSGDVKMPDEKEENPKLCFCYSVFLAIKIFSEAENNDLARSRTRWRERQT